ncbi:ABC transporter permease [Bosea sp. BK604]|uniref:ABC transporter permease n=1 Tax=Bosea sp. BK604 TaxID=2512180 RepID=UPI00104AFCBE|nr:ABC transporter permease [Bosea sp. BK604]TCR60813.1 putative spermidine/putrescine transport system permease protein [Bosea sp. BK604]
MSDAIISGRRSRQLGGTVLLAPATLVVLIMLAAPLALLVRYSFNRFSPTDLMIAAVTPENYVRFFTDPFYLEVMRTTIGVALLSTVLCLILGLPIGWRLSRMRPPWRGIFIFAMIMPLFVSSTVRALGWMILFARGGVLDLGSSYFFQRHFEMQFSSTGVVIGIVSANLPYMVLMAQSVFAGIDDRLSEAARGLGAAPVRAFWRVIWPLAIPGIAIATIMCLILGMNAYATPILLGGPRFQMMAPLVYWEFGTNNNWPFASALAFVLMATTLLLAVVAHTLVPRRYRA